MTAEAGRTLRAIANVSANQQAVAGTGPAGTNPILGAMSKRDGRPIHVPDAAAVADLEHALDQLCASASRVTVAQATLRTISCCCSVRPCR